MWDDMFTELDSDIGDALAAENERRAFDLMQNTLDSVWDEVGRVLVPGGLACINIGDATRALGDNFRIFDNHTAITQSFKDRGFDPLPSILWHKPTNTTTKFMGSGMIPPNAYTAHGHEHILVFRNGPERRSFEPHATDRYEAAYFWEERNKWFSDLWNDVSGISQDLPSDSGLRDRAAAYPFEIPYRLINMYSTYGDTVLDPFWGTGTTTQAAIAACRNSVGYEIDGSFIPHFEEQLEYLPYKAKRVITERLDRHREFVEERNADGKSLDWESEHYKFPVMTKQEQQIRFYTPETIAQADTVHTYDVTHNPL